MPKRTRSATGRNGPTEPVSLVPKMESAAVALASGYTLAQASAASGAGITTIKVWQGQPEFSARVQELRQELTSRVMHRVSAGMLVAVEALERLCTKSKSEATRLKAAEAMLTHGISMSEVAELRGRIDAIEQRGKQR